MKHLLILVMILGPYCSHSQSNAITFKLLSKKEHWAMPFAQCTIQYFGFKKYSIFLVNDDGIIKVETDRMLLDSGQLYLTVMADTVMTTKIFKNNKYNMEFTCFINPLSLTKPILDTFKRKQK